MKKALSMILALIMLIGVIPLTVSAQEADTAATGAGLTITNDLEDAYLGTSSYYSGVIPAFLSFSVTGGSGSYTYKWYYCGDDEYSSGEVVATTTAPVYEATQTGYYWCSIDDSAGNYTATRKARVQRAGLPDTEVRIWGRELYWKQSPAEDKLPDSAANGVRYSFKLTREDTTHQTYEEYKKIKLERRSSNNEIIGRTVYGTVVYDYPVYDYDVVYDPDLKVYKLPLTQFIGTSPYSDIRYYIDFYSAVFKRSDWRDASQVASSNVFQSGYHTAEEYNKYGVNIPEDVYHYGEVQLMQDYYVVGNTITPNYKGGRWADCPEKVTPYVERLENDRWVEIAQTGSYTVTSADVGHLLRFCCKPNSAAYGQSYFVDEYFYSNEVSVPISGSINCAFEQPSAGSTVTTKITPLDSNQGKYLTLATNTSSGTGLDWMCDDGSSRYNCNGLTFEGGNKYTAHVYFNIKSGYSLRAEDVQIYFHGEKATVELQGTTTLHAYKEYVLPQSTEISKVWADVTAPKAGSSPVFSASPHWPYDTGWKVKTDTSGSYINGVIWYNATDGVYLTSSSRFEKDKRYKVTVLLETKSNRYHFMDTDEITAVINQEYATAEYLSASTKGKTIVISYTFDLDELIHSVTATIPEPVIGQTPQYTIDSPSGSKYYFSMNMSMTWYEDGFSMKKTDTFRAGHEYSVKFSVYASGSNKFAFDATVTVNGRPASFDYRYDTHALANYTFASSGGLSGSFTSYLNTSDAVVFALIQNGSVKYSATAAGNTGTYSIPNVASGSYTLRVSKNNHVTREYSVTVSGSTTKNVKIHPYGDVDGDGSTTTFDFALANSHAKGVSAFTDPYRIACANIDGEGDVTTFDAALINSHAKGVSLLY